ncbi:MAG TPA: ectoine hydrolase DoeA [Acidimicrobiaceae bacterium]|nr:ectoine hydrolase DoeA [Acidimicrobiaceae bacterium]
MPDVDLPFTRDEYASRLTRVRAAMDERGIDVLVAADPSNMSWLTGYDGWSFYTPQAVVVTHDDDPVWWGRMMDATGALRTVYMDADHIVGYSDDHVMSTERHAYQHLSSTIADLGHGSARIGVESDNYYYSAAADRHLRHGLPDAHFSDATGLVNWQRAVKSEQELVYMRRAARIVERMHDRILELVEPGLRKNDLVAEIYRTAISGTDEFGGDYPAIVPLVPTGADASAAHLTWDDRPFEYGSGTFFEIAGVHRRYHVPLCRSVYLGDPPAEMLEAEKALVEGLESGLDVARAGNRACDVADALYSALERVGIEKDDRCGYPIGLSYPPDWGERTISFRRSDESVLEPGMTFHFMPGLWMDDWGLEITESFLIREDGPAETLADYPRKLFVKP